jgi:NAD(P)-dependent dehydrogenase (short-subunit alcohol dehydrogenase family)
MKLEKQVAIVTGASRGIGSGVAVRLSEEGASVVINYNNSEKEAKELLEQIRRAGHEAMLAKADVSNPAEVREMVKTTLDIYGRVDVLVNNAAIAPFVPFMEITYELWERTLATNLTGVFLCSQAVVPIMIKQKRGKIINISSVGAERGQHFLSHYAASKGGINALTRAMAVELGPYGINVIGVGPGPVAVERNLERVPDFRKIIGEQLSVRRAGEVEDIANVVTFLVSEEASFINGQIIYVDGGQLAQQLESGRGHYI